VNLCEQFVHYLEADMPFPGTSDISTLYMHVDVIFIILYTYYIRICLF
jgi:hypothetical protein